LWEVAADVFGCAGGDGWQPGQAGSMRKREGEHVCNEEGVGYVAHRRRRRAENGENERNAISACTERTVDGHEADGKEV
jgi:hypothetical protein